MDLIQYHDEAYYIWIEFFIKKDNEAGEKRMKRFSEKFSDKMQFYYLFFKCDTKTGDKTQEPLKWFESVFENIEIVHF